LRPYAISSPTTRFNNGRVANRGGLRAGGQRRGGSAARYGSAARPQRGCLLPRTAR